MLLMKKYPHIEIRPAFFPLHSMAPFQEAAVYPCPNSEVLYRRLVCLPSSALLQEEDVKNIAQALVETFEEVKTEAEATAAPLPGTPKSGSGTPKKVGSPSSGKGGGYAL